MNRRLPIAVLTVLIVTLGFTLPVSAQRIGIEETPTDTEAKRDQNQGTSPTSGRIIPPEEFGKYESQKEDPTDLSQEALIEKLRADSASMRIRFQEKLRELKADSKSMRKKIRQLRRTKRQLQRQLGGEGEVTERTPRQQIDTSPQPMAPPEQQKPSEMKRDTTPRAEEKAGDTQETGSLPDGTKLNPNTASLSELKSISGLSDRLAERIEWYRREVRPFDDIQDLRRVPGIDRSVFERIKQYFHSGPY